MKETANRRSLRPMFDIPFGDGSGLGVGRCVLLLYYHLPIDMRTEAWWKGGMSTSLAC